MVTVINNHYILLPSQARVAELVRKRQGAGAPLLLAPGLAATDPESGTTPYYTSPSGNVSTAGAGSRLNASALSRRILCDSSKGGAGGHGSVVARGGGVGVGINSRDGAVAVADASAGGGGGEGVGAGAGSEAFVGDEVRREGCVALLLLFFVLFFWGVGGAQNVLFCFDAMYFI